MSTLRPWCLSSVPLRAAVHFAVRLADDELVAVLPSSTGPGVEIRPLPVQESPAEMLQKRLATLPWWMSEARDRELPIDG
jgi:hypothetical protein